MIEHPPLVLYGSRTEDVLWELSLVHWTAATGIDPLLDKLGERLNTYLFEEQSKREADGMTWVTPSDQDNL